MVKLMTGEAINNDQPLVGKKRTKKKSLIGIDPLAWMNDEVPEIGPVSAETEQKIIQEIEPETVEVVDEEHSFEELATEPEAITETEVIDQETKKEEVTDMDVKDGDFKLDGPISIADVAELHEKFKAFLAEGNDLEIDCSEVEGVDAAALQLLTAFINEAEKQDNKLVWKDPSDSLQTTVLMMGLQDEFKM